MYLFLLFFVIFFNRLAEVIVVSDNQSEVIKRRDSELVRLKSDLDEARLVYENGVGVLRKKQMAVVGELSERIEVLEKCRVKLEKEKVDGREQLEDVNIQNEQLTKENVIFNCIKGALSHFNIFFYFRQVMRNLLSN
jgi:hypothetical protein